jgi:hypothetical protein
MRFKIRFPRAVKPQVFRHLSHLSGFIFFTHRFLSFSGTRQWLRDSISVHLNPQSRHSRSLRVGFGPDGAARKIRMFDDPQVGHFIFSPILSSNNYKSSALS